jgi:hypothetical protein
MQSKIVYDEWVREWVSERMWKAIKIKAVKIFGFEDFQLSSYASLVKEKFN